MAYGKTLTGLAPETTYYYAFFATNDVTDVGATVTGSFTTPVAATVACALEIPAGVSVKAGGLTYTASTTFQMPKGDEVVFEAVPAAGYKFLYWEGAVSGIVGMSNPLAFASEEACALKPVVAPDLPPATFVWRGGDGDWADGANWDVGRVPTSGDAAAGQYPGSTGSLPVRQGSPPGGTGSLPVRQSTPPCRPCPANPPRCGPDRAGPSRRPHREAQGRADVATASSPSLTCRTRIRCGTLARQRCRPRLGRGWFDDVPCDPPLEMGLATLPYWQHYSHSADGSWSRPARMRTSAAQR